MSQKSSRRQVYELLSATVCLFTKPIISSITSFHSNSLRRRATKSRELVSPFRWSNRPRCYRERENQKLVLSIFKWDERKEEIFLHALQRVFTEAVWMPPARQPLPGMNGRKGNSSSVLNTSRWMGKKEKREALNPSMKPNEWMTFVRRRLSQYFVTQNTHFSYAKPQTRTQCHTCVHISRIHSPLLNVGTFSILNNIIATKYYNLLHFYSLIPVIFFMYKKIPLASYSILQLLLIGLHFRDFIC
jgi:hypothetical protein